MSRDNINNVIQKDDVFLAAEDLFRSPAAYADVDIIVNKSYLQRLEEFPIITAPEKTLSVEGTICFFPIRRVVLDHDEDIQQKLSSVYTSASSAEANLAMIIRGYSSGETELYLGVCGAKNRINDAYPKGRVLYESFLGNFPGCRDERTQLLSLEDTRVLLNRCFDPNYHAVASVSCIASLRDEHYQQNTGFYQGLDKIMETMVGCDYSIMILANPLNSTEIECLCKELEDLYLRLSAYAKIQLGLNWSDARSVSLALSDTLSRTISDTDSASLTIGKSQTHSESENRSRSVSSGFHMGAEGLGSSVNTQYNYGQGTSEADSKSIGKAISKAVTKTKGETIGHTITGTQTDTIGQSVQLTIENKTIIETLNRIDGQLKRIRKGFSRGLFASAAYVIAPTLTLTRIAASTFKAVVSGNDTNLQCTGINTWTGDGYEKVIDYLRQFQHPCFNLNSSTSNNKDNSCTISSTPAVLNTAMDLAIMMGLPRNKLGGLPVRESVSFERNIVRMNSSQVRDNLLLGKIYYLDHEEKSSVYLNLDDLTMHCLITGTTGSGKSNTVYGLLNSIVKQRDSVHYMVIEPVKGDYKTVFGLRNDVQVYGTNKDVTKLLKINPFRFRKGIHVLEHIDRLINIFNVCWPMEAAMPSVLKQAVERAYVRAGWDLKRSQNLFDNNLFPSFQDVLDSVNMIMDESEYSAENKGNYKGALCMRIEELTTGQYSMMFVCNDLTDEQLFDENIIVDLSRLGSSETKSLIMGLLVTRLVEYRQSKRVMLKSDLCHVTVLEEAHNLLKRTSTEQSMDSANITGKAVEMISNSLAELRSTGEGFIIVDQAPEMLDLSAVRNTNTKIVLRMPEASDRELVGHSMSLKAAQIDELSKLPTGIAAVYQNDWMGAALVKIPFYPVKERLYCEPQLDEDQDDAYSLIQAIAQGRMNQWTAAFEPDHKDGINTLELSGSTKYALYRYMSKNVKDRPKALSAVVYSVFNTDSALKQVSKTTDVKRMKHILRRILCPSVNEVDEDGFDLLLLLLLSEQCERTDSNSVQYDAFIAYLKDSDGKRRINKLLLGG